MPRYDIGQVITWATDAANHRIEATASIGIHMTLAPGLYRYMAFIKAFSARNSTLRIADILPTTAVARSINQLIKRTWFFIGLQLKRGYNISSVCWST